MALDTFDDWRAASCRVSEGHFIEVSRCPKKRCLLPSKADIAADFAFLLRVASSSTMPVALSAASMLWWMTLNAPA